MDLTEIIEEWSYRLPKGFPTMKDGKFTVKSELKILRQVLAENGIEEIPDFTKGREEPIQEEKREEAPEVLTKDQMITLLSDPKITILPKNLARISALISRTAEKEESIETNVREYLAGDSAYADQVLDILYSGNVDEAALAVYLQDRKVDVSVFANKPTKLSDAFKSTGLSPGTLGDLALYRWSATPQLGTLEVLLALLLKDGFRPATSGDLVVGGVTYEVGGFNKRLRAQKGLGSSGEAQAGFKRGYLELAKKKGILDSDFVSISGGAKSAKRAFVVIKDDARYGSNWNNGWMSALEDMNKQLKELTGSDEVPVTNVELIEAMSVGFGAALLERKSPSDWAWIEKHIKDDGTLNRKEFLVDFACEYLDYYMGSEGSDAMFILTDASVASEAPSKSNFSAMVFPATGKGLRPHIFTTVGLTIPSYREKSGIQGVAFALKLGKLSSIVG